MQTLKNKQEFFAHIHAGINLALTPSNNNNVTDMLFNNLYAESRAACLVGFISQRDYLGLVAEISDARAPEELNAETPDLLGGFQ